MYYDQLLNNIQFIMYSLIICNSFLLFEIHLMIVFLSFLCSLCITMSLGQCLRNFRGFSMGNLLRKCSVCFLWCLLLILTFIGILIKIGLYVIRRGDVRFSFWGETAFFSKVIFGLILICQLQFHFCQLILQNFLYSSQ